MVMESHLIEVICCATAFGLGRHAPLDVRKISRRGTVFQPIEIREDEQPHAWPKRTHLLFFLDGRVLLLPSVLS